MTTTTTREPNSSRDVGENILTLLLPDKIQELAVFEAFHTINGKYSPNYRSPMPNPSQN